MSGKNSLAITDNRTGKAYEIPITDGAIRALDLRQIKTGPEDFGLLSYDPAFTNTASTRSAITFIGGGVIVDRRRRSAGEAGIRGLGQRCPTIQSGDGEGSSATCWNDGLLLLARTSQPERKEASDHEPDAGGLRKPCHPSVIRRSIWLSRAPGTARS